jgi:PadR family transcriptional regulator AphA
MEARPAPASHELSATGRVILGMLAYGKETGYEIKQFVDKSTRFFWAASYGQIYPELRRLEVVGYVQSHDEPSGGRARTVYRLTDAGRAALGEWLRSPMEPVWELRDEGMLRLFFSDTIALEERLGIARMMRARHQRKLDELRQIQVFAQHGPPGPRLTLRLGIRTTEAMIEAWTETERLLGEAPGKE